jgi:hypothetical protein
MIDTHDLAWLSMTSIALSTCTLCPYTHDPPLMSRAFHDEGHPQYRGLSDPCPPIGLKRACQITASILSSRLLISSIVDWSTLH